jgi:hypothetical protein
MNLIRKLQDLFGLGGKLTMTAVLTTRHLVPDPNGDIIAQDGVLCREIRRDRRRATRCVTDAYAALLVDELKSSQAAHSTFKYHDSGTGTGDELAENTGLGTPCGDARDVGTQDEGATANIYKSVATHTYGGSLAITEHGLFSASSGATLMDRSKFAAVNVTNGEKIGNGLPLVQINGQYGVNCGNSKGNAHDNPQPSLMNDIKVVKKVHRLEVEESTNKTSQAPRILCFA